MVRPSQPGLESPRERHPRGWDTAEHCETEPMWSSTVSARIQPHYDALGNVTRFNYTGGLLTKITVPVPSGGPERAYTFDYAPDANGRQRLSVVHSPSGAGTDRQAFSSCSKTPLTKNSSTACMWRVWATCFKVLEVSNVEKRHRPCSRRAHAEGTG